MLSVALTEHCKFSIKISNVSKRKKYPPPKKNRAFGPVVLLKQKSWKPVRNNTCIFG